MIQFLVGLVVGIGVTLFAIALVSAGGDDDDSCQ